MCDNYIDLSEAAKRSPGRPHSASVWRWCRRGIKARNGERIHLAHIRAGGRIFILPSALETFFRQVAEADRAHFAKEPVATTKPPTDRQRQGSVQRAERTLTGAGIL